MALSPSSARSPHPELTVSRELNVASEARAAAVAALPIPSRIHISGICGTGMTAVLSLLKSKGHYVTGSDKAFYPPMGQIVRDTADEVYEGYAEDHVARANPDLVVIGNALSRSNPEVEYVLREGIPFASMPEVFSGVLIGDREHCRYSIVVVGTHGKSTTTSAVATLLDRAGWKPGYFIGGVPKDLPSGLRLPDITLPAEKRVVVLEGDEYDSAFFAKYSKFHSYRPDIAILTSLEFDHADIFNSLEDIAQEFTRFVARIPADGALYVCGDDANLRALADRWAKDGLIVCPIFFYGEREKNSFRLVSRATTSVEGESVQRCLFELEGAPFEVDTPLTGRHNAVNLLAATAALQRLGVPLGALREGVRSFHGVLRRQHELGEFGGRLLIEDFAHHPTAVSVTLEGIHERYPNRRVIAVFEPRSNTSRRAFFQEQYAESFDHAAGALLLEVKEAGGYSGTAGPVVALDVQKLVADIRSRGVAASAAPTVPELETLIAEQTREGDVVVIMTNGDFGGLLTSLPKRLAAE